MKKSYYVIMAMILGISFLLTGCGKSGAESEISGDDGSVIDPYGDWCINLIPVECKTLEESADTIYRKIAPENAELFFEHEGQRKNPGMLTLYLLENIPERYKLYSTEVDDASIKYNYIWVKDDGTESLIEYKHSIGITHFESYTVDKTNVEHLGLSEWTYGTRDDFYFYCGAFNGIEGIHQIYWAENGYKFQANIPCDLIFRGSEDEGFFDLTLKEVTFPRNAT